MVSELARIFSFNPTLVRLRLGSWGPLPYPGAPFQSHAGSIEAGGTDMGKALEFIGFNPTLVRLRPWGAAAGCDDLCRFNPTLVRLRRQRDTDQINTRRVSIPRWFD